MTRLLNVASLSVSAKSTTVLMLCPHDGEMHLTVMFGLRVMDGWMDGWMDGCRDVWTDGWMSAADAAVPDAEAAAAGW